MTLWRFCRADRRRDCDARRTVKRTQMGIKAEVQSEERASAGSDVRYFLGGDVFCHERRETDA